MEIKVKNFSYTISNKIFSIIIVSLISVAFFVGVAVGKGEEQIIIEQVEEANVVETPEVETIKIYITGCVNNPGIIEIEKGSILNDIINEAGGLNDKASTDINLVYKVFENVMINVRSEAEVLAELNPIEYNKSPGDVEIISDDGGKYEGLININTASVDELCTLPGVGEATAQKIISYRNEKAKYLTKEDIMKVDGIKESRYDSIKDYICVK